MAPAHPTIYHAAVRVLRQLSPEATLFESKMYQADSALALDGVEITGSEAGADVIHVYGKADSPTLSRPTPVITTTMPEARRAFLWKRRQVAAVHDAIAAELPDPRFAFTITAAPAPPYLIGSIAGPRPHVRELVDGAMRRLARFRDDVEWLVWDGLPERSELEGLHLWVDPAVEPADRDGFVVEALFMSIPVLATRTPVNESRLAEGAGRLVRCDPNELTHAIARALFDESPPRPRSDPNDRFPVSRREAELKALYDGIRHGSR